MTARKSRKSPSTKQTMVYLKQHNNQGCIVLAVCDENTLGKTFSDGRISITVNPAFYQGKLVTIPTALQMISESPNTNLTGKEIVRAALKAKLLKKSAILKIGSTAHAQRIVI